MADQPTEPTVSPYLTVVGADKAIIFYADAFGATEKFRMAAEDGERLMHATLEINGAIVMLSDDFPEFAGSSAPDLTRMSPVAISLRLDQPADVDATFAKATKLGAKSIMDPEDMFWGDRFAMVSDPFGHRWMLVSALEK